MNLNFEGKKMFYVIKKLFYMKIIIVYMDNYTLFSKGELLQCSQGNH